MSCVPPDCSLPWLQRLSSPAAATARRPRQPNHTPTTASPTADATSAAPTTTATLSPTPDELSPKPPLESPAPLGQPACKGSALTVADADTLVDPQTTREVYAVRTSGPDCQLQGYPTVTFQDASGRPVPVSVQHSGFGVPADKPQPVTLSRLDQRVVRDRLSARRQPAPTVAHVDRDAAQAPAPGTASAASGRCAAARSRSRPVMRRGDID